MKLGRAACLFLMAVAALLACSMSGPANAETARAAVEDFNSSLISILKAGDRPSGQIRYRALMRQVARSFDLAHMMQKVAGSRWRTASAEERAGLVDAFLRMSIATYLLRFRDYSGEYFETVGEQGQADGIAHILTRLVRPGGLDIPVTYVAQRVGSEWRIVDLLFAGGISELALRKSEFAYTLAQGGLPGLILRLNEQADKLVAELPAHDRRDARAFSLGLADTAEKDQPSGSVGGN